MAKRAEDICAGVNKDIRPQAETLARAVLALQAKIEQQIPVYEQFSLAQQVTIGSGKDKKAVLRANPATQEFRATVRDYAAALNNLQNIIEQNGAPSAEVRSLDEIRARIKVAK